MGRPKVDITGQKFERLTALYPIEKRTSCNGMIWHCKCDCGKETDVAASSLRYGKARSCGCLARDITRERVKGKAFHKTHGGSSEHLYGVWAAMKRRCEYPKDKRYKDYGGRGIKVCERWRNDYAAFKEDAIKAGYIDGQGYGKCTIDRIDVNGDYCPENCRWVDMGTQNNNRRNNNLVTYNGETKTVAQWARETGINAGTLYSRIERGWTPARALEAV